MMAYTSDDTSLTPSLWSSFPPELLDLTLSFLPFPYLFRLRTVCRHWNALPHSPYFHQISPSWSPCLPVLFSQISPSEDSPSEDSDSKGWNSDSWSAFNTSSHRWLRLPPLTHPKSLVVGSRGLLCIGDFDSTANLVVCNPVTRAFRELPPTLEEWTEPDLTSMIITGKEEGYKLVLAGDRGFNVEEVEYRRTEVYDSELRVWEIAGEIPKNLELHSQEGALCGNVLYCLARDPEQCVWNALAGFDVGKRTWRVVSQTVPHGSRTPHVVACLGRILAIAEQDGVDSQDQDESQCAILYELDLVSKKWRELSRLPSEMYVAIGKRVVACTVDGDYICITGCRVKRWYSVMCRSSESKWQHVPAFPVENSKGSELLLSSSPFRPSLEPV